MARKTAIVYKRCDIPVHFNSEIPNKLKISKEFIQEVISNFSSNKNISNQGMIPIIKRVLS